MTLLWTFMGYSMPYTIFAGLGEVIAAVFLLFRRTQTFGALVTVVIMSNVVMMNLSYDVPVKLFSSHLLFVGAFLLFLDRERIVAFLFPKSTLVRRKRVWVVVIFALVFMIERTVETRSLYNSYIKIPKNTPLHGIFEVVDFELDGTLHPPLLTDDLRWHRLILQDRGPVDGLPSPTKGNTILQGVVQTMSGNFLYYPLEYHPEKHTLRFLHSLHELIPKVEVDYEIQGDLLVLRGTYDDKEFFLKTKDRTKALTPLLHRGFHWVNEYPYYRQS